MTPDSPNQPQLPIPVPLARSSPVDALALMIKRPWVDYILASAKTWEIRGTNTHIRGEVFFAVSGTGTIAGKADLVEVVGPLGLDEFQRTAKYHLTPPDELERGLPYRKTYAWVFKNPVSFDRPIRYRHPSGAITWVSLKGFKVGTETLSTEYTPSKFAFVKSFSNDIQVLGHAVETAHLDGHIRVEVRYADEKFEDPDHVRAVYRRLAGWAPESSLENSAVGCPSVEDIRPDLAICRTKADNETFDLVRQQQAIPNSGGAVRSIRAILWDRGSTKPTPMGVIGLSAPLYGVQCRDDHLEWNTGSKEESRIRREEGLKRMLHLSVCGACPPYNALRVGRLLALLAFSRPISDEFQSRWGERLFGISTTSAFGSHGSIFRRIHPNRLEPAERYSEYEAHLYRRIGETSGEYFPVLSRETKAQAVEFLKRDHPQLHALATGGEEGVVKIAMREAGLPRDLLRFVKMGYFLGCLHPNCLDVLKGSLLPLVEYHLEPNDCVEYWRREILRNFKSPQ